MQALTMQRSSATIGRAFTTTRPAVRSIVTPQRSVAQPLRMRQPLRAADDVPAGLEEDLADYGLDSPLPTSSAGPAGDRMSAEDAEMVKLRIRMRGYSVSLLQQAVDQVANIADATGAVLRGPIMLPTKRKIFCVLTSPHVDKDAREHFETRTHNRLVDIVNLSSETVSAMMSWVPPAGLEVECSIV